MAKQMCPHCGSWQVIFKGMEDGGGESGNSVCEILECQNCLNSWEENCRDYGEAFVLPTPDDLPDDVLIWLQGNYPETRDE